MSILSQLATTLNRRDEEPNKQLAMRIADIQDKAAVTELVQLLQGKNTNIQSDCIKVLDEIGYVCPGLIVPHTHVFLNLLKGKNNRLVWGAMAALNGITSIDPAIIYEHLTQILDAADNGTVITKDHAVNILAKLAANTAYAEDAIALLIDQLKNAPLNQLPTYAEQTASIVTEMYKPELVRVLQQRLPEVEQESKRKRLEKVLKKLQK